MDILASLGSAGTAAVITGIHMILYLIFVYT